MSLTLQAVCYGVACALFVVTAIMQKSTLAAGLAVWVLVPFVLALDASG